MEGRKAGATKNGDTKNKAGIEDIIEDIRE